MVVVVDIVTGATQGIGRAVAAYLALQHSASADRLLVLTGRNLDRGRQAAAACSQDNKLHALFEPCDLSRYSDVVRLKDRINKHVVAGANGSSSDDWTVGILVNAAGECPARQELVKRPQRQPANGETIANVEIDRQFATNVLGYHFTTKVFADHFAGAASSNEETKTHVVNIASNWAGNLDLDDLHFRRRGYDNDTAYRQSKQCNRMLTAAWADQSSQKGAGVVIINACHPGDPCTTLSRALGYNLGAGPATVQLIKRSPIPYLCGLEGEIAATGQWFEGASSHQPRRCAFAGLARERRRLFEICESFAVEDP